LREIAEAGAGEGKLTGSSSLPRQCCNNWRNTATWLNKCSGSGFPLTRLSFGGRIATYEQNGTGRDMQETLGDTAQ
jgi:hypothetical protein